METSCLHTYSIQFNMMENTKNTHIKRTVLQCCIFRLQRFNLFSKTKTVTVSTKTGELLIGLKHTELSVGHLGHSPNNLSGAPAVQIPVKFKHSVNTFTNIAHWLYLGNTKNLRPSEKHLCKDTCGSHSQCSGMVGLFCMLNTNCMRFSSVTQDPSSDS